MNKKNKKYIIGIDEVGRGPLAGPVVVCAVLLKNRNHREFLKGVNCSKKISKNKREFWAKWAKDKKKKGVLDFKIAKTGERMIEKKGITFATNKALESALFRLGADSKKTEVLLDGLLKAPDDFKFQKTIIKGDEKEPAISLASVIAKVHRDEFMRKKAKNFPLYGFEFHKGYGTEFHRKMIKKHGYCKIHRKNFIKNFLK